MRKIVYIAGYGRSGSTVLDAVLGSHQDIIGVGEVSLLNEWSSTPRTCGCGARYPDCPFWGDLLQDTPQTADIAKVIRKLEWGSYVPRLVLGRVAPADREIYRSYHQRLFQHIQQRSNKSIIVDSSKTARGIVGRFTALKEFVGEDVYVVHLVRNGLSVMESVLKGNNQALEGYTAQPRWAGARAILGWLSANLITTLLGNRLGADHYMVLRYEDFVADPATALQRIGQLCGFDPTEIIAAIERNDAFAIEHRVGGNRLRREQRVRLRRDLAPRAGEQLKPHHRLLFAVAGGWLNRRHGYR